MVNTGKDKCTLTAPSTTFDCPAIHRRAKETCINLPGLRVCVITSKPNHGGYFDRVPRLQAAQLLVGDRHFNEVRIAFWKRCFVRSKHLWRAIELLEANAW